MNRRFAAANDSRAGQRPRPEEFSPAKMKLDNVFTCLENCEVKGAKQQENEKPPPECQRQWLQFVAAISACISLMACGGHLGWTSPSLPYLKGQQATFPVNDAQGAWIASLYILGAVFGSLLSPLCIDRLGRKFSLLAFALPQLAGWGLIIGAQSFCILYVARFVAGIGHGGICNISVIYLAEIADKNIRGALGTFFKMSMNLGSLYVTTLGAYLSYQTLNLVSLVLPLLFIITFIFMPETPYFYLIRGQDSKAVESLMQLRRLKNPDSVKADIDAMKEAVVEGQKCKNHALVDLVKTRGNRRGLLILLALKATQQFSGHMAIVAYTQEIFSHSGSSLPPQTAVVLLGVAQLGAGIIAAGLVDKVGRRILMLLSGSFAALALSLVGMFFYLKYELQADVSSITWLPVAGLILYEIMVALGVGTLPYVILGEIFPTNVKGTAVAIGIIIGAAFAFVVGLGFQFLNNAAGTHTTFWFYAGSCIAGTILFYLITPETKGKTLEEIQAILNPKKKPVGQV